MADKYKIVRKPGYRYSLEENKSSSHEKALSKAGEKKKVIPKHYRGNTMSEGGISFGKKPKSAN